MSKDNSITISEHVSSRWHDYARYVITKRGIPNFYDGLTDVQRVLLDNAPTKFSKSVSLVGNAIASGYSHGNQSLEKSLNGMAKEYGCAMPLLEGDGFFGTPVSDTAAAVRYTSSRINPEVKAEVDKYKVLNKHDEDGMPIKFHVDIPIGVASGNTGIGIGFKSKIHPRSLDEIKKFLEGNTSADLRPHFNNFNGKVESYGNDPSKWIISGRYELDSTRTYKIIRVLELPPIDRYDTFIKKVNKFLDKHDLDNVKISNNSQDKINLELKTKSDRSFDKLKRYISKTLRSKSTEQVGFIRDGRLVMYDSFKDYLKDFKVWREEVFLRKAEHDLSVHEFQLSYSQAQLKFLQYMQGRKASRKQIKKFLSQFDSKKIRDRLLKFPLYRMSKEKIKKTKEEIKAEKTDIKNLESDIASMEKALEKLKSDTTSRATNFDF